MKKRSISLTNIINEKGWTLFLDRDGVINKRLVDDYVKKPADFEFVPNIPESLAFFSTIFDRIFVVTNQQGIGKGLMTVSDLEAIHHHMLTEAQVMGAKIDKVYFCPDIRESNSLYRKPNIGMGLLARKEFPEIRFRKSMMAGDSLGDMQFGKRLGMITILISDSSNLANIPSDLIDYRYDTLYHFANDLKLLTSK